MSVQYGAIGWNRQKKIYDVVLLSIIAAYLGLFVGCLLYTSDAADE